MISFSKGTLTDEEAFWTMRYFLEIHYKRSPGAMDISDILSATQPFEFNERGHFDGKVTENRRIAPADSGMISDWNKAVE